MSKAIAFLRDIGNPYFQNIIIKCMFCQKHFEDTDDHVFDHVEECYLNNQVNTTIEKENSNLGESSSEEAEQREEDEIPALMVVKKYQALDDVSCVQI